MYYSCAHFVGLSSQFVFKGTDFRTSLINYERGHIQEEVKIYYRSFELVGNMPRHPNIMAPAQTSVTLCRHGDDKPEVCGSLHHSSPMEILLVTSPRITNLVDGFH